MTEVVYPTRDETFAAMIDEKGNDYTGDDDRGYYFKTAPDTFGDGPYYIFEVRDGWVAHSYRSSK